MAEGLTEVTEHIARNVETIGALHVHEEHRVDRHQRAIEALTAAVGRPSMLYTVLAVVALWTSYNALAPRLGAPRWDAPPFFWLQGVMATCGLLVATMVLITQNRQGRLAAMRSHLDLQVNLLAEQKIAKLIALVEELRRDLPDVRNRPDTEAEAMAAAADPEAVLHALDVKLHAVEVDIEGRASRPSAVSLEPPHN